VRNVEAARLNCFREAIRTKGVYKLDRPILFLVKNANTPYQFYVAEGKDENCEMIIDGNLFSHRKPSHHLLLGTIQERRVGRHIVYLERRCVCVLK
jgi:hypothetical protein